MFNKDMDFVAAFNRIGTIYKQAVEQSGVKRIVYLNSVCAHLDKVNGSLLVHHNVENILKGLPDDVFVKFMHPVGFYTYIYRYIHSLNFINETFRYLRS